MVEVAPARKPRRWFNMIKMPLKKKSHVAEVKTSKAAHHGHVDIVWIAGIVICAARCFSRLGVTCA